MTAKYTPGPWTRPWTADEEFDHEAVLGVDGILVADCAILAARARPPEINKANARLIAAAPELVEALVDAGRVLDVIASDDLSGWTEEAIDVIDLINAALKKAGVE